MTKFLYHESIIKVINDFVQKIVTNFRCLTITHDNFFLSRCISSVENILEHAQEPMESQNNANVNNKHEFWAKQDQYEQSQQVKFSPS